MADTNSLSTGRPEPRHNPGASASALASVPPEVKTTFRGRAPTAPAMARLASSTRRRALRPSACTDEALPQISKAIDIASRASLRSGVVAFQSR